MFYKSDNVDIMTEKGRLATQFQLLLIIIASVIIHVWSLFETMVEVQWLLTLSQKYKW